MSAIEIIFAILLILSCVFIIAVVLMQESKQGMSNVITGGSTDNYFQKNSGRTREAKLARATKIAAVLVFVVAIAVNLITVYLGGEDTSSSDNTSAFVTDSSYNDNVADLETEDTEEESDETAEDAAETEAAETAEAAEETTAAAAE